MKGEGGSKRKNDVNKWKKRAHRGKFENAWSTYSMRKMVKEVGAGIRTRKGKRWKDGREKEKRWGMDRQKKVTGGKYQGSGKW